MSLEGARRWGHTGQGRGSETGNELWTQAGWDRTQGLLRPGREKCLGVSTAGGRAAGFCEQIW